MSNYTAHPLAELFPMMSDQEYRSLVEDMRVNGYDAHSPIVLYQGKILDGRNRYKAVKELGIQFRHVEYEGGDPLAFVIRHNLTRRHLNETQRATVAARLANMKVGGDRKSNHSANLQNDKVSQAAAAEMLNVSPRTVATVKAVEKAAPELVARMENGEMTANEAYKEVRKKEREQERKVVARSGESAKPSEKYRLIVGDIREGFLEIESGSIDVIITDPPYPRDYIPLYRELSTLANRVLKPGALCVVMTGQSYLPEIILQLSESLTYHWTSAYLTPGAQSAQIFPRKVNPFWKPLLIFSKGEYNGKWFGDVVKSAANDKDFHEWGQSESGMTEIVDKYSEPGATILDPFCGAGATGLSAIKAGRLFVGADISKDAINITAGRLSKWA